MFSKRLLRTALVAVFCAYLLVVLGLFFAQDRLLFPPVAGSFALCPSAQSQGYEALDTHDARPGSERIRAYVHRDPRAKAWVLIFHGNAESACDAFSYSKPLSDLPLNFALIEYPGYQGDASPRSQDSFLRNADAAYDYFAMDSKTPVFLIGRSLGTGVATYLASTHPSAGLILISPYSSIEEVAADQYPFIPVRWLLKNPFPASDWARKVFSPTLIIHGTADRTIPIALAKELSLNFPHLPEFIVIPGAGHHDILDYAHSLAWKSVRAFLELRLRSEK